jgi:hypothetical protein
MGQPSLPTASFTHHTLLTALLALVLVSALPGSAAVQGFDHEHKAWDALLKRHVVLIDGGKASRVRYDGFARDRGALKSYLALLSGVSAKQFGSWTKAQRMAFLINAYNAYTIEKILVRYPDIRSIWDFGKIFGNPFKDEFFMLLGEPYSLDRIEHGTLRAPGAYDEPRVHFAVNCASVGCPMLREEAYVAGRLDAQLEEQTRRFLSDRSRNRFDPARGRLEVSKIFDWYEVDWTSAYRGFKGTSPPVRSRDDFLAEYAELLADTTEHQSIIRARKAPLDFLDYDWALNDVKG